jgi:hypothetical protein
MTSISCSTAATNPYESRLLNRISSATTSGQLSQADGKAIGSALGDIASQLQSSATSSGTSGINPGQLRKQVGSLIQGEVSSGKLTQAQADELKGLLQPGQGAPGGPQGPGGAHHGGGAHHAHHHDGDGDDASASATDSQTASSSSATGGDNTASSSDPLSIFLTSLADAQKALAGATYSQNGAASTGAVATSLGLIDQTV